MSNSAAHVRTLEKYLNSREPGWFRPLSMASCAVALSFMMASRILQAQVPTALFVSELHGFTTWTILHVASLVFILNAVGRAAVVGRSLRLIANSSSDHSAAHWADAALTISLQPGWPGLLVTGLALLDALNSGTVHPAGLALYLVVLFLGAALGSSLALTASLVSSLGEGLALGIAWTPVLYMLLHCGLDFHNPLLSFSPASLMLVSVHTLLHAGGLLQIVLLVATLWYYLWRMILARLLGMDRPTLEESGSRVRDGLPVAVSQLGLLALLASFSAASLQSLDERLHYFQMLEMGLAVVAFCIAFLTVSVRNGALRRQGVGEVLSIMPVTTFQWARMQAPQTVIPSALYAAFYAILGLVSAWLLDVPFAAHQVWLVFPAAAAGLLLGFAVHPPSALYRVPSKLAWMQWIRTFRLALTAVAVVLGLSLSWAEAVGTAPCPWALGNSCRLLTTEGWPAYNALQYPVVSGRVAVGPYGDIARLNARRLELHDGCTGRVLWSRPVQVRAQMVQFDGCSFTVRSDDGNRVTYRTMDGGTVRTTTCEVRSTTCHGSHCCGKHGWATQGFTIEREGGTCDTPTLFPTPANCFVRLPNGAVRRLPFPQHGIVRNDDGVLVVWQGDALQWYLMR